MQQSQSHIQSPMINTASQNNNQYISQSPLSSNNLHQSINSPTSQQPPLPLQQHQHSSLNTNINSPINYNTTTNTNTNQQFYTSNNNTNANLNNEQDSYKRSISNTSDQLAYHQRQQGYQKQNSERNSLSENNTNHNNQRRFFHVYMCDT